MIQGMCIAVAVLVVAGCATGSKGPSDHDLIMSAMNQWQSALVAKDADSAIAVYSENFRDGDGRGKAEMHAFLKEAISMGYLDSLTVDMETAQVTINSDDATVSPVTLSGSAGSMYLKLALKKEEGVWRIVSATEA
jgi:ketosteroid isomerase-like protein